MAIVKNLMVRSGADFSALYKEMNKSQRKLSEWQNNIGKILKGIGAIVGGLAVGQLFKDSIRAAMDVEGAMLQIQRIMGASAAVFENWAQTQAKAYGMAREEAYQYGAIYGNLISSFARDTQEVTRYTMELLQASAVVASRTGRTMTDVMERIRSGLLGNTEAIEDLGIHVNIAMLESTKAFRQFARGRSWNELAFQEQQQIRLLAILEQANQKYGNTLADNVQTKQLMLIATLKNIRLNFGQAFLPVYDTILPILTDLANTLEANKETLQRWGQSIAGVIRTVVKGFSLITGAIVENWQAIKFVGTTLLTYVVITKGVAAATTAWRLATLALKGELMTKVPVLTAVSTAIRTYRLQMALAPVATNLFTAALLRLRVALYAVHTALGPIGWVILAISAAISGGTALWSKYAQSLQKAAQASPANLAKGFRDLEKSTKKSADATEEQADALNKAGKAANKNLQSFDEIHQLQKDMAEGGGAGGGAGIGDLGDLGWGSVPDLDIGDAIMDEFEETKPTLKGFWNWLWGKWEDWVQSWDWVQKLSDWLVDTFYDETTGKWGLQKVWGKWEDWVQSWDWVDKLSDWIVDWFYDETSGKWGLQKIWGKWSDWVGNWNWTKSLSKWIVDWFYNETSGKWGLQKVWGNWSDWVTSWGWTKTFSNWIVTWFYDETTGKWTLKKVWSNWESWVQSWDWVQKLSKWLGDFWNDPKKKWDDAVRWIKDKVRSLKDAFKFDWKLPRIKLPHFYVTWSTSGFWGKLGEFLGLPGRPILGVNWYAEGGIFNQPSVIGVGEAGAEAVVPLDKLTGIFADALRQVLSEAPRPAVAGVGGGGDIYVYIGNEQIDAYIYRSQDRRNIRSNGR